MSLPLNLPPLANLALYLLIVMGMIAVAVALDRWLAVAELRPADRQHPVAFVPSANRDPVGVPAANPAVTAHPATARRGRALPIPALLPRLAARERAALWTIVGGALALRVLFPEAFPAFLTGPELTRAGEALRIMTGVGTTSAPPGLAAALAGAWTLFGTTLPLERLLTALCVVAALLPFHALLRRVVGVVPALGATLLFSVSRPALLAGRGGEADPAILLLAPLTAWLLLRARERGDGRSWAFCGLAAAALLLDGATGWGTLLALAVWFALLLRGEAAPRARRQIGAGLLFAGGVALLIAVLATLAGGGGLRAAIPFALDGAAGAGPLAAFLGRLQAFGGALFAVLTGSALDPGAAGWRDPVSALLAVAGAILAVRLGRGATLWWCIALIPTALAGIFGGGDPQATLRVLLLLPGYAFVAVALDALLRWERLREPFTQLVGVGIAAALILLNVVGFALWSAAPATLAAQGPTIATSDFYLWRDYQVSNLAVGRGIVGPDEYATLAPATIVEQIAASRRAAAGDSGQASAAPREDSGQEIARIGVGENGGHLTTPRSLAIDRQGGYYVADTTRGAIVHFGPNGVYIGEWPTAQIAQPWAIVALPDNLFLVLDADTGRIGRYDGQGNFLGLAFTPQGGVPTRGLNAGLDGKVYAAQTAANHILALDLRPGGRTGLVDGGGQGATFDQPTTALADASGNVVIYESDGGHLRGVSSTGQVRFNRVVPASDTLNAGSLAILPDGRIALVDARGARVLLYSATGNLVGSFPVAGSPQGIAVTPIGLLAVTDLREKVIRLYTLTAP